MKESFDINDDSSEIYIEFMKPQYNLGVSAIDYEVNLVENSLCHDTYF